jgi:hypothetical protein
VAGMTKWRAAVVRFLVRVMVFAGDRVAVAGWVLWWSARWRSCSCGLLLSFIEGAVLLSPGVQQPLLNLWQVARRYLRRVSWQGTRAKQITVKGAPDVWRIGTSTRPVEPVPDGRHDPTCDRLVRSSLGDHGEGVAEVDG